MHRGLQLPCVQIVHHATPKELVEMDNVFEDAAYQEEIQTGLVNVSTSLIVSMGSIVTEDNVSVEMARAPNVLLIQIVSEVCSAVAKDAFQDRIFNLAVSGDALKTMNVHLSNDAS